jgi:hypothetical protein
MWTSGRGEDTISTLRALADQLGYPVGTTERRVIPVPPPRLVVVKRDARDLYERLTTMTGESVTVMWDRRQGERRSTARLPVVDRRRWDRRRPTPADMGHVRLPRGSASGCDAVIATTPAPDGLSAW